jgi:hypothetical protein
MPIFKVIHFFNKDSGFPAGWSEVWYTDAANFDQAEDNGVQWAGKRAQILSSQFVIQAQRVTSNIQHTPGPKATRKATLKVLNQGGNAVGGEPEKGDLPWSCVNVRWRAADVSIFRSQLLRGLPDDWYAGNSDKIAKLKIDAWLPQAVRVLAIGVMRIRHKDPLSIGGFAYVAPASAQYIGYTKRDTGRPFGLLRGRQPKQG